MGRIGITVSRTKMHLFPGPDDHAMNSLLKIIPFGKS
jgi:hypothetical protein